MAIVYKEQVNALRSNHIVVIEAICFPSSRARRCDVATIGEFVHQVNSAQQCLLLRHTVLVSKVVYVNTGKPGYQWLIGNVVITRGRRQHHTSGNTYLGAFTGYEVIAVQFTVYDFALMYNSNIIHDFHPLFVEW
jgi:hypothetical protein